MKCVCVCVCLFFSWRYSIYPIHRHPLMFMTKCIQCLDNFSKCNVKIFIYNHHIQIFLVFPLQQCTLLDCCYQIIILKKLHEKKNSKKCETLTLLSYYFFIEIRRNGWCTSYSDANDSSVRARRELYRIELWRSNCKKNRKTKINWIPGKYLLSTKKSAAQWFGYFQPI